MGSIEQGSTKEKYVVNLRTLCFLTDGEHVLLIHGSPDKRLWAGLYNGVGGHVEKGEDVYTACLREVKEETGVDIVGIKLCGIITIETSNDVGVCVFVFRGEEQFTETWHSPEGSLKRINQSNLLDLPLVPDLREILPRVLTKSSQSQPFFAHYSYDEYDNLVMKFSNR